MMRPENNPVAGQSNARLAGRPARCVLCNEPLPSHVPWCAGHPAFSTANRVAALNARSQVQGRGTHRLVRVAAGSFSTRRGGGASRSWSVTGSSGLVCRRLRHAKRGSGSGRVTSASGRESSKTSVSTKSSTEAGSITGQAAATRAEWQRLKHTEVDGGGRDE